MSMTILTVDDSRAMRDMWRHSLMEAGFRVIQAEDGLHGLEVLASETPDVIVIVKPFDPVKLVEAIRRVAA